MIFDPSKLNLEVDENKKDENNDNIEKSSNLENNENWEIKNDSLNLEDINNIIQKEEVNTIDVLTDLNSEEIIKEQEIVENKSEINDLEEKEVEKVIYDINISSIKEIFLLLIDKNYDFVTFAPFEDKVKIDFRKDKIIIDTKYIKYPIYSQILIKVKTLTKLDVEESNKEQEWVWEIKLLNKNFEIISKTIPSAFWEKIFLKLKEKEKKVNQKKEVKKMSFSQIAWFMWALAFVWLVIWWTFLWFIVLNAKTVEDVKFFAWLWINLNEINSFISQLVSIVFSIIVFLETILLVILLFKFSLTKKEFKKRKIRLGILAIVMLIISVSTASTWMYIDQKIKSLPNWQEMALWEIQIYDNSKLLSESFDKIWSLIYDTSNLIWPIEIKFDLEFFKETQKRKWINVINYIWDFWSWEIIETPLATIIKNFDKKWVYNIKLTVIEQDLSWNIIEKIIEDIPTVNIQYNVEIEEKIEINWWKTVNFNASDVSQLWKIQWFLMDDLNTPVHTWERFFMWRPVFEETIIWMYIDRNDRSDNYLDKIFIIKPSSENNLNWEIKYQKWIINDLEYIFSVSNIENDFWAWFIENYKWKILDKEYSKKWDIINQEKSSEIKHIFETYWDYEITVELTNSAWNVTTLRKNINIPRSLNIKKWIDIYMDWILVDNVDYKPALNEYIINNLWVPNEMKFDARFIEIDTTLYTLETVNWDYNSNWDNDFTWRVWEHNINSEWLHTITAKLKFVNRRIKEDIIEVEQKIFVNAIRKEAILDFNINQNSEYVPTIIWFDASRSTVRDSNIVKFIWDYGDWTIEERDAVVPWRRYIEAWIYDIKLKVVTLDWREFSKTKKLILKPAAQTINIKSSMRNAPVFQWIDFSSSESEWQIVSYFWDFWDWNTSTQANPTHIYKEKWEYNVKLRLDFSNRNILEDSIKINIY